MADDKIVIQITLDDGSVIKGFANLEKKAKATGKELEKSVTGKAFDEIRDSAEGAVPAIGRLASMFPKLAGALGVFGAALYGVKKLFDFSVEGEKIQALEKRFDMLAQREGLVANKLKQGLQDAAGGLVSLNDLFQAGSRAIATMGANAERLPELLGVAKKSATALGLDVVNNFEDIARAVETGNQKALKNAGIIVDVNKVYQDYAETLGITANELNETQKQAALLDAVLKKGKDTFKGVNDEATPLVNATKILGVAFSDLGEKIKTSISNTFGKDFTYVVLAAADAINKLTGIKNVSTESDLLRTKIERLNEQIKGMNATIEYGNKHKLDMSAQMDASRAATSVSFLKKELADLTNQMTALEKKKSVSETVAGAAKDTVGKPPTSKLDPAQMEAERQRAAQIAGFISQNEAAVTASREKLLQFETDAGQRSLIQQQILNEKRMQLDAEQEAKIAEVNKTYSAAAGFSEQERQQARLSVVEQYAFKRAELEAGANEEQARLAKQHSERMAIIQSGLNNIIAQGAVKMSQALLKGGNAFEEFGKSIVGIIADEVVKLGQALIIQGLAIEAFVTSINSLLPGSGMAAAAAGMGLVLFGTALKAAVGGGAPSGATPSVTPGGAGTSAPIGETTSSAFQPVTEAGTRVTVNIQGDVLDSNESSLRIVELMNQAFEKQGTMMVTA